MTVSCLQSVEAASASSLMVESDVLVPLRSREDSQWVMIVVIKQQNMILQYNNSVIKTSQILHNKCV